MSEISNKEVNENTETTENTDSKELSTSEKFDSLSDEDKMKVFEAQEKYKAENPDATKEEIGKFLDEEVDKKYNPEDTEDDEADENDSVPEDMEREKIDDLHRRGNALAASENLTDEEKTELYKELSSDDDIEGVITKYEALEEKHIKEKEDDELDR